MDDLRLISVTDHELGIRYIRVNRPDVLNALNLETLKELQRVLKETHQDPKVRVVLFGGEGGKSFIAGADISEMVSMNKSEGVDFSKLGHEVAMQLEELNQPTIAVVNGFALGGGTEMAIACDFILASDTAVFGQPEVGLGIIPGFGGTFRLLKQIALPMAKELIFTGRKVKADEALRIGLVNHVYPAGELDQKAMELAQKISKHSFMAVVEAKKLMNEFTETSGTTYKVDSEARNFGGFFGTKDQQEGMTAFVEKRSPKFEGLDL